MNKLSISEIFDVTKRNIAITGAAGLLGSQYASTLCAGGANLILIDYNESQNTKLQKELSKKYHTKVKAYTVDITNEKEVIELRKKIIHDYGRIDGLINNAAFTNKFALDTSTKTHNTNFEEYPSSIWEKSLAVNLTGMFYCCREFGREMMKQKAGVIVNIASTYGIVGADQRIYGKSGINSPISYAAAKGAVINLTRYLAAYWQGKNIRVNTLSPGGVVDETYQSKEFIKNYSYRTMLGRMAKKDEYNGAILFLMSDASSYMTGANLVVDGGWTAW